MHPLSKKLMLWFMASRRDLPWRENLNPYRVWVSEVMLQQTQVSTVIPYFEKWMDHFPTLESLAKSPIDQVLKLWEGLGYYSRARNLHKGAQQVMKEYQGHLPSDEQSLRQITGIGPYTCSAIRSFAFHKKCSLIDGNVKRVMSRLFELNLDFSKQSDYHQVKGLLEDLIPEQDHWIFNEALMELGALICIPKKPLCLSCPLQQDCGALKNGSQESFPIKMKRRKTLYLHRLVLVFQNGSDLLVQKQSAQLMRDLYQFVHIEVQPPYELNPSAFHWAHQVEQIYPLATVKHAYTHHQVTLYPYWIFLREKIDMTSYTWMPMAQVKTMPFSSGHRKVLQSLLKSTIQC